MNIAIFASAFFPSVGGVEELCRQLAHEYQRRGIGVIVLTNRWPRNLPAFESYEGIPVYRIAFRVPAGYWRANLNYSLSHRMVEREVLAILRDRAINLLHVQCVSCNAHYALAAKRKLGLPLLVTLQGELKMDAAGIFDRPGFAQSLMRRALTDADAITACSSQTLREAEDFMGESFGQRGAVIYNGISLQDFAGEAQPGGQRYILAIGRHVPQKGFDVLLRAYAKCVAQVPDAFDLILAGDGPERESLQRLAGELKVGLRVRFCGRVDNAQAVELFQGCEFFVLPSRHEPMGIVNLEAMAAGKAVIATRVGGVPELVVEDETGVLVSPDEIEALSQALSRLMSDATLCSRLGEAGRLRAEQFDWPDIAAAYMRIYSGATVSPTDARAKIALTTTKPEFQAC